MFSELIYTRCRQGIDILMNGRPVSSDGYKVFSCSSAIINDSTVDLPFLFNTVQSKQAYNDPAFMDDAYLFFTPDKGENLMLNFHPVPFVRNAQGAYSHRSGNFINQVFIGSFQDFYPYELFGSAHAWNAKDRGEAYYYDNPPSPLPMRNDIDDSVGSIVWDDICAFVADGRKEALAAAVAFLLAQFSLPPENRKYLIIQDEDSSKIELWIAAIESAFSPRMASRLSFATRLDKFTSVNKYTVNANGQYQAQINLQDPNQRLRYRAMIVGVDERDRANSASVRQLANSPYAILNGKTKSFNGDVATSHPYYAAITAFDDNHSRFCRGFLQMLDISAPCIEILDLYSAYTALKGTVEALDAKTAASSLSVIEKYGLISNSFLTTLYFAIKNNLPRFLCQDISYAFTILAWLTKASPLVGDAEAAQTFSESISKAFCKSLFCDPQGMGTAAFWARIQNSAFFNRVADYVTAEAAINSFQESITQFSCDSWQAFLRMYLVCAHNAHRYSEEQLFPLVSSAIYECYQRRNGKAALQICELTQNFDHKNFKALLLKIANGAENSYVQFVLYLLLSSSPELTASNERILSFCRELQAQDLGHLCAIVLQYKAKQIKSYHEMEQFLSFIISEECFSECDLSNVYSALDSGIVISDSGSKEPSVMIQETRQKDSSYKNSAHVCASLMFKDKKMCAPLVSGLQEYVQQGFPSVEDAAFAEKMIKDILSNNYAGDDLLYIFESFSQSTFYLEILISEILKSTTQKNNYDFNMLLCAIVKQKSKVISDVLVDTCARRKLTGKQLAQFEKMIDDPSLQKCFADISAKATEKTRMNAPQSKIGKLFKFGSSDPKGSKY